MSNPATHPQPAQLVLPRGLIFLTAIWFVGSLLLAMGLRTPVHASAASLEPGIRLMLQSVAVGLVIGWPLLRLSQQTTPMPLRQTLLDLATLITLLQIIVWVPRMFTVWTVSRTAAIDAMLVSWTVLIGAIVAAAAGTDRPLARTVAMVACIVLALLGPILIWSGLPLEEIRQNLIALGPVMGIPRLAEGGATPTSSSHWQAIAVLASAAVICWIALSATVAAMQLAHRLR